MSRTDINSRLYVVFITFILIFTALIARLFYVQLIASSELKSCASQQHNIYTEITPLRGLILDRGLKELAVNRISYSIFATNEFSSQDQPGKNGLPAQGGLGQLAAILDLDIERLSVKLNSLRNFVWLKRKVSPEVSLQVKELGLPGIGLIREQRRFYPDGSLACHLLGFTDIDNNGLEGIELYADSYLAGVKGWRLAYRDAKSRELLCWGYQSILPADGYDLVLTIDRVIQSIVERHLRQAVSKYKAQSASAIVMQPDTGGILALYNYPDFDLNSFSESPAKARRNLAITDIFEPGSSFKFVTAAAVLEEGLVRPEDKFFCEQGQYSIGGRILHDYRPYGKLSFREIIEHSSNIGMAKIAQLLGEERLYAYIKKFGFGELTGIDLPGEVKGIIRAPQQWSKTSLSSIPMGQEVAVTPIQLLRAIACVGNDGILVKPKIIKLIRRKDGQIIKSYDSQQLRRVISTETAQALRQMLVGVVENGTGQKAKVSGYLTAGKTGTAQKANPLGGYHQRKYFSSFIGFVPAERPLIAILVVLNEPYPQYFGGTVCAPVFKKIATETLRYLELSNETERTATESEVQTINQPFE